MAAARVAPLRVIEIAQGLGAAICGRLFAGLGHDVVKVEPPGGDFWRTVPPLTPSGESLTFIAANADKSSVVAACDEPAGQRLIHRLLDDADVAIIDLPPRLASAAGLVAAQARHAHPELVIVSITGFGVGTTYSDLPADSMLAEAYGGLATMIGDPDCEPLSLGGEQAAHAAGVTGFLGAMLALAQRDQGLPGDFVDVAMCDVAAYMDWKSDVAHALEGRAPRRSTLDEGGWRLVKASDGWLGAIFLQRHWDAVVNLVGAPALADPALRDEATRLRRADEWWPLIEEWASTRTAKAAYEQAQAAGLPFGWVATTAGLLDSEQLASRGFIMPTDAAACKPVVGSPIHCEDMPWRAGAAPHLGTHVARAAAGEPPQNPRADHDSPHSAAPADASLQPLNGVTVLDFGTITAGAAVSRLLADFGATVLKVEWVDKPDTFRSWKMPAADLADPSTEAISPYFPSNNVGKLGVAINLKEPEGRELVHELARASDVVIENYRVGVTRRLGIDFDTLAKLNPDLLYLSLSSQGQQGPEAGNSSYGSTLDLLSGLASLTGYDADHPLWSSSNVNYPDQLVSLFGAAAIVYCLRQGIVGTHLDVSQREVVSWTLGAQIADFVVNQNVAHATGNRRPGRAPHGIYPCAAPDTWVAISCANSAQRLALARCIDAPSAFKEADFASAPGKSSPGRPEAPDAVDALIAAWTSRFDRADCVRRLHGAGVPAVPVLDAADRAGEQRFTDRLAALPAEAMPVKGLPMLFDRLKLRTPSPAPRMGEHTRAVLRRFTTVSDEELDDLDRRGVVRCAAAADISTEQASAVPLSRIELA